MHILSGFPTGVTSDLRLTKRRKQFFIKYSVFKVQFTKMSSGESLILFRLAGKTLKIDGFNDHCS